MGRLRGSIVLKQLDLSLVGQFESPKLHPEPSITEEAVVPILTSIINAEGTSLIHLQLPQKWRGNRERTTLLADREHTLLSNFLTRYDDVLVRHQNKCAHCSELFTYGEHGHIYHNTNNMYYGLQNDRCYKCVKPYCNECEDEDGRNMLNFCYHCKKDYCVNCGEVQGCECGLTFCSGCDILKPCESCDDVFCPDCAPSKKCACGGVLCGRCTQESTHSCKWEGCEEVFCSNCQDDHLLSHRLFDCD